MREVRDVDGNRRRRAVAPGDGKVVVVGVDSVPGGKDHGRGNRAAEGYVGGGRFVDGQGVEEYGGSIVRNARDRMGSVVARGSGDHEGVPRLQSVEIVFGYFNRSIGGIEHGRSRAVLFAWLAGPSETVVAFPRRGYVPVLSPGAFVNKRLTVLELKALSTMLA